MKFIQIKVAEEATISAVYIGEDKYVFDPPVKLEAGQKVRIKQPKGDTCIAYVGRRKAGVGKKA